MELQEGKTVSITLKLHKGLRVTGTVTDEAGKPIVGAQCSISMPGDVNDHWDRGTYVPFTTDEHGHFDCPGLPAGKGTLRYPGEYNVFSEWALSTPPDIEVPAKEPIQVRFTHVAQHTVTGRVLDTGHHPLAGVSATFNISYQHIAEQKVTAVTGADGSYQLAHLPETARISLLTLVKPGYRQLDAGAAAHAGGNRLDDAVMASCAFTVQGKVYDAGGKPVPGATVVSVEGGLAARAVTDAMGTFILTGQPESALHLVAATPTGGGLATCPEHAADIRITCMPGLVAKPRDIPLALAMLEADGKLPVEQRHYNDVEILRTLADIDLALANKLAAGVTGPAGEGLRAYLLAKSAEQDPAGSESAQFNLAQFNLLKNPDCRFYAAVEVGIAELKTHPEISEQLYAIAKKLSAGLAHDDPRGQRMVPGLGTFQNISLRILALAALLQQTADVDALLAQVGKAAKQAGEQGNMVALPLFEAAARVSPEFVLKVYDGIDVPNKARDLGMAVTSMAQHDPAAAQRLLDLLAARQITGVQPRDLAPLIKALGKQDPAAALALAKAQRVNRLPALLAAAAFQPKDVAHALLQDFFEDENNRTAENIAQVNAIAPDLAKAFYLKYQQTLEAQSYNPSDNYSSDGSPTGDRIHYAFLISSIDPVEARLILETEFPATLSKAQHGERRFELQLLPQAMYTLDPRRAQQMLDAGAKFGFPQYRQSVEQWMMRYILMTREERASDTMF